MDGSLVVTFCPAHRVPDPDCKACSVRAPTPEELAWRGLAELERRYQNLLRTLPTSAESPALDWEG